MFWLTRVLLASVHSSAMRGQIISLLAVNDVGDEVDLSWWTSQTTNQSATFSARVAGADVTSKSWVKLNKYLRRCY
jgi:hypothetical protein